MSIVLGGSAKPLPRKREHPIRKEKEAAMAYIKTETAKYDRTQVEAALKNKLETTVHKIAKKQKEQIIEEQKAMRRIDRLEDLFTNLVACESKTTQQAETMANLKE